MPKINDFIGRDSANGEFSPKINKELNKKLNTVCMIIGVNKTKWCVDVLNAAADHQMELWKDAYYSREASI